MGGGRFNPVKNTPFKNVSLVESIALGDLNNDGFPELYIGRRCPYSWSDNFSFNHSELHFVLTNRGDDLNDKITFRTNDSQIKIDFLPGKGLKSDDPSSVFVGKKSQNPPSRCAIISARDALGQPEFTKEGIYVWKDENSDLWHLYVQWNQTSPLVQQVGLISCTDLYGVCPDSLEKFIKKEISDLLYINNGGKFSLLKKFKKKWFSHQEKTRSVVMSYDFDNNGFPDIVGIRGTESGDYNGDMFILLNHGDFKFRKFKIESSDNDIYQSDKLCVGFFDQNGLPDVFVTNGWGLVPSNWGPYQFWRNNTSNQNNFVAIQLKGTVSNTDAINAQVELYNRKGKLLGYRERIVRGRAQDTAFLHFGLGDFEGILRAKVFWPNGKTQEEKVMINHFNYITEK